MDYNEWKAEILNRPNAGGLNYYWPESKNFTPRSQPVFIENEQVNLIYTRAFNSSEDFEKFLESTDKVFLLYAFYAFYDDDDDDDDDNDKIIYARMCLRDEPCIEIPLEEYANQLNLKSNDKKLGTLEGLKGQMNELSDFFGHIYAVVISGTNTIQIEQITVSKNGIVFLPNQNTIEG